MDEDGSIQFNHVTVRRKFLSSLPQPRTTRPLFPNAATLENVNDRREHERMVAGAAGGVPDSHSD